MTMLALSFLSGASGSASAGPCRNVGKSNADPTIPVFLAATKSSRRVIGLPHGSLMSTPPDSLTGGRSQWPHPPVNRQLPQPSYGRAGRRRPVTKA
jgi:hypothetical protein